MTPDMRRLCEAVENAVPMVGQDTVMGRTEDIVRAVLNELREPSEAMRAAGRLSEHALEVTAEGESDYSPNEPDAFTAMIDAVLTGAT